ncbi:MAG: DUF4838 domain-containing protein [Gemmata sp.]
MPRVLCLAALLSLATGATAAPLVRDGKAVAFVVLPPAPDAAEKLAARELIDHVEKISGAKLETVPLEPDALDALLKGSAKSGMTPVVLGRAALPKFPRAKEWAPGAFALTVAKDHVLVAGAGEGTAFGVCELLEQLGVRWFLPGPLGTVIPESKTLTLKEQESVQAPSFPSRWFQMPDRDWQVRVRCGGPVFPGGHGLHGLPKFADAPDLYALVGGKRTPRQHCLSNPKVLDLVVADVIAKRKKGLGPIIGMGPNDGRGFCECEHCKRLDAGDFDPFSNEPSVTDRYVWFFNRVLERLGPDHKDVRIAFYIYHSYMRPPVTNKPDPRIMGALAPIALDRVHGFSNPVAPEKSYAKWLYQEWGKLMPELYDRGYWSNLSDPGLPFIIVHRLRDEIPACHELGVKGWRVETFPNYAATLCSNYIAAKLMWNHRADVDALLADFADKYFGPAAKPMGAYVSLMDAALRDSPYCTGSAWDMPHHYPERVRAKARGLLLEATQLAKGKGDYAARVRMVAQSFDMLEAFVAMLDARARCDFPAAKKELDRLDQVAKVLMDEKPVAMISSGRFSTYTNYMNRFFRPATEQGHKRVTGGSAVVASAKDEWEFLIDPPKVGEAIGLWKPGNRGGNWQTIKTSSSSWSNQGYRYYKGMAWYRQAVEVPKDAVGKRVFLWCGGVDEKAKVWLNGKPVGISPGAAFYPFELDATDAVRAGKNEIVFAVLNDVVNELGTGGIVAPVILYAPAGGKDAKLENLRPLGETFP